MVLVDVAHDHIVQPSIARLFRAIARWLAAGRAERRRQVTLQSLLFAPEHRLRDLGISHDELIRMVEHHR
jgi:uncharacterized protein YjiS (DUF1127 family)